MSSFAVALLAVSLSTALCRANPIAGWASPIAPINAAGRRFSPYSDGRRTIQSYPVSISVIPGNGGFQQDDHFRAMPGSEQMGPYMSPSSAMGSMNSVGSMNHLNQINPMGPMNSMAPSSFGQSPFQSASPFGPPQMGSSNSIVGMPFDVAQGVRQSPQQPMEVPGGQMVPQSSFQQAPQPEQPTEGMMPGMSGISGGTAEAPGTAGAPGNPAGTSMGQPKLPPFLEGTSQDIRNRFFEVIQNRNDAYMDKQKKLDELIAELDDDHKKQYQQFIDNKAKEEEEKRQKVHTIVATMSDEAQTQFAKISTLLRNPNIGDAERWQKVQQIYDNMSAQLKEEFEAKFTAYG
uniref:DUF148 domain-containing protein n=1 Tax=Steinernema glaseri TaxID=37863 RepID=A0A1I7Z920_9BILA